MSDLDFEELDKAVNSLVGGTPKGDKKEASTEAPKPVETAPKPDTTPANTNLPSRRAGRFMDMKHDSSDMTKDNSPSLMTSTKTTIAPISKDVKAEPKKESQPDDTSPKNEWDNSENDKKDEDKTSSSTTNMPDPIDHFESQQKEKDDKPEETPKPDDSDSDKKDENELKFEETDNKRDEHEKDDKKPSPFIDDAKVEKRPLGGFSSESTIDSEKKDDKDSGEAKDGEEKPAEVPVVPIELPPELDKDLVAIEAGEAPESAKKPESPPADIPPPADDKKDKDSDKEPEKDDSKDKKDDEPKDAKHEVSQLLANANSGSIPDQCKRENRSHELHSPHPLFDSEHLKTAPSSAPKKPRSKAAKIFQWIFIALGLLLLGGSLGAAIFVFVSQS